MFCDHLVYFPRFGILYREKSGNPSAQRFKFCKALKWLKRHWWDAKWWILKSTQGKIVQTNSVTGLGEMGKTNQGCPDEFVKNVAKTIFGQS
jgi:hypothetical protein